MVSSETNFTHFGDNCLKTAAVVTIRGSLMLCYHRGDSPNTAMLHLSREYQKNFSDEIIPLAAKTRKRVFLTIYTHANLSFTLLRKGGEVHDRDKLQ